MDGGCGRHDDACRHDTRQPGSYRPGARCGPATRVIYAAIVLAAVARLLTAFDSGATPRYRLGRGLGAGVRELCHQLRSAPRQTAARARLRC